MSPTSDTGNVSYSCSLGAEKVLLSESAASAARGYCVSSSDTCHPLSRILSPWWGHSGASWQARHSPRGVPELAY